MNKFYLNYLLILFVSFLAIIGCSTDDEIIVPTQKIEKNQKFYIFSNPSNIQNKGVQINDYAKGFAITMQKYDSVQKTNITGLVNTQNTFSNNAKLRQNFINEAIEPYVETRIHSENIIDKYGNISVFYPKIFNNKVQDIFIAQISEDETLIKYYILNKDSNIYNNTVKLFQEKYDFIFLNKISKLLNKTNSGFEECGFEGLPSCDLGTVIITPGGGGGNGTIPWSPGGGATDIGGGGCKPHEMCSAPPSDGGGSGDNGEISLSEVVIKAAIKDKPFAFIDVPCDIIKQWLNTAKHSVSNDIIAKLNNISKTSSTTTAYGSISTTNVAKLQDINNAYSTVVNMDYFPVTIDKLPPGTTAEQLLNHIRTNINSFVDTNYSYFEPYHWNGINDTNLWNSSNPLGAVIGIDIKGPDNGSVVVTKYSSSGWTFSTIYDPTYLSHPVSGHRDFGFTKNTDGSYTFYTRGVDRLTDFTGDSAHKISEYFSGKSFPFSQADSLWKSFQKKISEYVNLKGGKANTNTPQIERPDWQKVKDVLDGKKPLSTLSNDCK